MGIIGYARVSRLEQNLEAQTDVLKEAGAVKIFTDKATGANMHRPGLEKCLEQLREGDVLLVARLDRLGRSLQELLALVDELGRRKVEFKSLKEAIDTQSSLGRLIFHIFGSIAEFEREIIRERTFAGLAAARARGRVGGRKRKFNLAEPEGKAKIKRAFDLLKGGQFTIPEVCRMLAVSKSTLYRAMEAAGHPVREINPNKIPALEKSLATRGKNGRT